MGNQISNLVQCVGKYTRMPHAAEEQYPRHTKDGETSAEKNFLDLIPKDASADDANAHNDPTNPPIQADTEARHLLKLNTTPKHSRNSLGTSNSTGSPNGSANSNSEKGTPATTPTSSPLSSTYIHIPPISEVLSKDIPAHVEPDDTHDGTVDNRLEACDADSESSAGRSGILTPKSQDSENLQQTSEDVIKRIPKPEYPIQIYTGPPIAMNEETQRRIMRWRYEWGALDPHVVWLLNPRPERIERVVMPYVKRLFPEAEELDVQFLAQGGFNKVYTITAKSETWKQYRTYIFRVAAPVYPYYKIESEVATMELVRSSTSIPLPIIYAYDSNFKNDLGFEWMLMEKINGRSNWYSETDWQTKLRVTNDVALWTSQLANITARKIGSIFMRGLEDTLEFYVGRSVHINFFSERNIWYNVHRGPFDNLESYYRTSMALQRFDTMDREHIALLHGSTEVQPPSNDEPQSSLKNNGHMIELTEEALYAQADRDDAEFVHWRGKIPLYYQKVLKAIARYEAALPTLLDPAKHEPVPFITSLGHHDMSDRNIFVDHIGIPVALLDWEHIQFVPAYFRDHFPDYLDSDVENEPRMENYNLDTDDGERAYKEDIELYEKTLLQGPFKTEIERLNPALAEQFWSEKFEYWRELCFQANNVENAYCTPQNYFLREHTSKA